MTKQLSTITAKAVKDITASAKKAKAQKEAIKFLIQTAKLYQMMKAAEDRLEGYLSSNKLGKDLLKEAQQLTREDVEALEEMIGEHKGLTGYDGSFASAALVRLNRTS